MAVGMCQMRNPIPQGEVAFFWGGRNVAAHCKLMGHSTVICAKTTEPIGMPLEARTRVGPENHVLEVTFAKPRNMIEPSVCGSDAALRQITFTTYY